MTSHSAAGMIRGSRSSGKGRSLTGQRERDALVPEAAVSRDAALAEVVHGQRSEGVVHGAVVRAGHATLLEHLVPGPAARLVGVEVEEGHRIVPTGAMFPLDFTALPVHSSFILAPNRGYVAAGG